MSGTNIKLNSCVNIVGEAFHGKNASLVDPTMKCKSHEGFKILLKNSSSDTHKGSSELGSMHIETLRSERTDAALVSSGIVYVGLSKDIFLIFVPQSNSVVQSNSEVNFVALNKSGRMLSGNHVENCLQRFPFDDRYQNNYEEHFA